MRKLSTFSAASLLVITLAISSVSTAAAAASSSSSNWLYQPLSLGIQATSDDSLPNSIPYCFTGSGHPIICYTPNDIRTAYNFPSSLDGTGQTILIVDAYGSPTIQHDLAVFDGKFGIVAPPSFTILCPTGCPSYNPGDKHHDVTGWALETSLDIEYAHAMAPGANIVLVVASSSSGSDINTAERMVIPQYPGSVMSQSFGIPEYLVNGNDAQIMQAEQNYVTASNLGITVFASAGDSGASNGGPIANAGFPASDPLVTAVGGTMGDPYIPFGTAGSCPSGVCSTGLVTISGSSTCGTNGRTFSGVQCPPVGYGGEQVWNEPRFGAAGGGAPSLFFGVPSYQSGLGLTSRATPDVSYNAAVDGGVLVFTSFFGFNAFFFVGGTSAGSPQWAAIAALANQQAGHSLGFLNPAVYDIGKHASNYANDFHDTTVNNNVLTGSSIGFDARTGWDDASGWGTPNVANLIPDLVSPP